MSASNKKMPRISAAGFAAAAVPQADPVAAVQTSEPAARIEASPVASDEPSRPAPPRGTRQAPSRAGRVQIMGWFPSETRLALKRVALESDKTLEQVMAEAFQLYLSQSRGA
jgi:hypothetical protein